MIENENIIIALIATFGGILGVMLVNHNWIVRQKIKYGYYLKRAKLTKKYKQPIESPQEPPGSLQTISNVAGLLKNLDSDQIGALIETFAGGESQEGMGEIGDLLNNPVVQKFIEGYLSKASPQTGEKQEGAF